MTEERQGSNTSWNKFKAVCCSCCRKKDKDVVAEMPKQEYQEYQEDQESSIPVNIAFKSDEHVPQSENETENVARAVKSNSKMDKDEEKTPNWVDNTQNSFISHRDSVEVVKERAKRAEEAEDDEEDIKQTAAEEEQKESVEPEVERKTSSPNSVKEKASNLVRKISESIRKEKSKGSLSDVEDKKDPS